MNESPHQYFLTQAGAWLDLYGHFSREQNLYSLASNIRKLKKDPSNLADSLDLVKHLALYTGALWQDNPEVFTPTPFLDTTFDLVAPPDNAINLEGTDYDKEVLQILIDRCTHTPRLADTIAPPIYYDTYDICFDAPHVSTGNILDTIRNYFEALHYEDAPELVAQCLNILLTEAYELYLRAWEHATS